MFIAGYLILYVSLHPRLRLPDYSKYTGDLSYGICIYAYPLQQLLIYLAHGHMQELPNFLLATLLTSCCAYLSWHLVKRKR